MKELEDEAKRYKSDALFTNSVMEENVDLKAKLKTTKKAVSEANKDAKEKKEDLWTYRLDRDYHTDLAQQKTSLASTFQNDLQAQTLKCDQLTDEVESLKEAKAKALAEVESLKKFNAKAALEHVDEMEDAKDAVKICVYLFWKHNRNADFSYLGDAYVADEAECLEHLAEEEAEAAARNAPNQNSQDPQA